MRIDKCYSLKNKERNDPVDMGNGVPMQLLFQVVVIHSFINLCYLMK